MCVLVVVVAGLFPSADHLSMAYAFPAGKDCQAACRELSTLRRLQEARLYLHSSQPAAYQKSLTEIADYQAAWRAGYNVGHALTYWETEKTANAERGLRIRLAELKEAIGPDNFYAGRIPFPSFPEVQR